MANRITLLEHMNRNDISAVCGAAVCGGKGTCGKCKVRASGKLSPVTEAEKKILTRSELDSGIRLACMVYVEGDYTVLPLNENSVNDMQIQTEGFAAAGEYGASPLDGEYGIAVDIGTTTLAVYLCNLKKGIIERTGAARNPQGDYGADVITRIGYITENAGGLDLLRNKVIDEINKITDGFGIDKERINHAVITGNTTMEHIFAGLDPKGIANAPFTPASLFGNKTDGYTSGLHIAGGAAVHMMPCFSAYVGGDIATGIVASGVDLSEDTVLYIDVGTNGEIGLGDKTKIDVCSAAAGPAFEGAKIEKGMAGINGAVSKVWIGGESGKPAYTVIGGGAPAGICGSGLIDAVAVMLELGVIDETGRLDGKFYIDEEHDIYISGSDVRELQLAKAAISAGILTLMEITGRNAGKVVIAGGFGTFMNAGNACKIGLIPAVYKNKIKSAGNMAGTGAALYLLNRGLRDRVDNVTHKASYTELSGNMVFMDKFIEQMYFEE